LILNLEYDGHGSNLLPGTFVTTDIMFLYMQIGKFRENTVDNVVHAHTRKVEI